MQKGTYLKMFLAFFINTNNDWFSNLTIFCIQIRISEYGSETRQKFMRNIALLALASMFATQLLPYIIFLIDIIFSDSGSPVLLEDTLSPLAGCLNSTYAVNTDLGMEGVEPMVVEDITHPILNSSIIWPPVKEWAQWKAIQIAAIKYCYPIHANALLFHGESWGVRRHQSWISNGLNMV